MILRNLENYPGVKINGENINNIRYADDTVLIADSEENLQRLLDITIEKSEEMGLTLNVKKTECMVISKKAIVPSCNLQSRGQQIKLVKKFKYLGYMITSDGKCITEIKKRIATAKDYLLTYCPSCHRQLGQQQILSISGGLEPVSVRFPMNDPLLSPLPQQYVSMSSLDARVFCVPLVSIRLLLLGWSLDLCVIYGLSSQGCFSKIELYS